MIPDKKAIIVSHHLKLILGKTAWDMQVEFSGMKFKKWAWIPRQVTTHSQKVWSLSC